MHMRITAWLDYMYKLRRAIECAATDPRIGRSCDEIRLGYRKLSVGSHTLYYRLIGDVIDIVRILHQRMDTDRHL